MSARLLPTVLGITLLTGCAAQELDSELPLNHPANPGAAIAAVPARSTTLRTEGVNVEAASAAATGRDHAPMKQGTGGSADDHGDHGSAGKLAGDAATEGADEGDEHSAHVTEVDGVAKPPTLSDGPAAALYVCPMHKEVTSATPARCPKCKMKLKARKPGDASAASARPFAPDTAALVEPASPGPGDAAVSESAAEDNAQNTHEGHDTQEAPAVGGGNAGHGAHDAHDAHAGHDSDGGTN